MNFKQSINLLMTPFKESSINITGFQFKNNNENYKIGIYTQITLKIYNNYHNYISKINRNQLNYKRMICLLMKISRQFDKLLHSFEFSYALGVQKKITDFMKNNLIELFHLITDKKRQNLSRICSNEKRNYYDRDSHKKKIENRLVCFDSISENPQIKSRTILNVWINNGRNTTHNLEKRNANQKKYRIIKLNILEEKELQLDKE
ncbi:unnamed protein product [Paramecium octaurelia]|uniref:Uncharacterized protein n=1 Tax=Paramecium octaurelia TaxID=43137 RepID=A0A8S1XBB9_PAROT|nr:unnamed protein product [Paramecium octaurelia]